MMAEKEGRLVVLREMVRHHIRHEGDTSTFGVRSGLLLEILDDALQISPANRKDNPNE